MLVLLLDVVLVVAVVLVLAGRAAHLTVAHARARSLFDQQIRAEQRLSAARGTVFDRSGIELAITTEAESRSTGPTTPRKPSPPRSESTVRSSTSPTPSARAVP